MPARTHKIRVMIADDHAILRAGLKMLVNAQADMEVVSEAADGAKAVQTARETKPDVALLLAWNHAREIVDREKAFKARGGRFITPHLQEF